MKGLKVVASLFLGLIMTVSLIALCVITVGRTVISGNFLGSIAKDSLSGNSKYSIDNIDISSEELEKVLDEVDEYVSRDEIYDQVGDLASQMIKYYVGAIDDIDTKELKQTIEKMAKKYDSKTGSTTDLTAVNEEIDNAVKEVKREMKENKEEREKLEIVGFFLKDGLYFGLIAIIVVCALLIALVNMSIISLARYSIAPAIINAVVNAVLGLLFKIVPIEAGEEIAIQLASKITNTFFIIAGISIIAAVVFITISIIKKSKPQKQILQPMPQQQ